MKKYSIKIIVTVITCIIALTACSQVVASSVSRETIDTATKTTGVDWKASSDSKLAIKRVEPIRKKEVKKVVKKKKVKPMTTQQVLDYVNTTPYKAYGGNEAREHLMNKYEWLETSDGIRYKNVYEFTFLREDGKKNMHVFWAMDYEKKEGKLILFLGTQYLKDTDFKYKEEK